jgi:hypothetical protein
VPLKRSILRHDVKAAWRAIRRLPGEVYEDEYGREVIPDDQDALARHNEDIARHKAELDRLAECSARQAREGEGHRGQGRRASSRMIELKEKPAAADPFGETLAEPPPGWKSGLDEEEMRSFGFGDEEIAHAKRQAYAEEQRHEQKKAKVLARKAAQRARDAASKVGAEPVDFDAIMAESKGKGAQASWERGSSRRREGARRRRSRSAPSGPTGLTGSSMTARRTRGGKKGHRTTRR